MFGLKVLLQAILCGYKITFRMEGNELYNKDSVALTEFDCNPLFHPSVYFFALLSSHESQADSSLCLQLIL